MANKALLKIKKGFIQLLPDQFSNNTCIPILIHARTNSLGQWTHQMFKVL